MTLVLFIAPAPRLSLWAYGVIGAGTYRSDAYGMAM